MISGYCMLRHSGNNGNNMIRKPYAGEGGYPPTQFFFIEKTLRLVLYSPSWVYCRQVAISTTIRNLLKTRAESQKHPNKKKLHIIINCNNPGPSKSPSGSGESWIILLLGYSTYCRTVAHASKKYGDWKPDSIQKSWYSTYSRTVAHASKKYSDWKPNDTEVISSRRNGWRQNQCYSSFKHLGNLL